MEGALLHCKRQQFETVIDAAVVPAPVKLVTTASTTGLQQPRKPSLTITVDNNAENLLGAALNALRQLASQQQLCSSKDTTGRREQLVGKKILFVCCGHDELDSKKFVFEFAKELGARVFLVEDYRNTLAISMEKSKVVEQFIRTDMTPRPELLSDVVIEVQKVSDQIGGFNGTCTFWDDAVGLCARIAEHLCLPGNSVRSVDISHDKHLTREAMESVGLPTPSNYLVKRESDLGKAAATVGFPAILKPMYGASSLAVIRVNQSDMLKEAYRSALLMLKHFYEHGDLMGLTFNESELGPTFEESSLSWLVMEEYLDGDEVDVDLVLKNGNVAYQCVVDDWPQIDPWFAEMGNNCPSKLPIDVQDALTSMAIDTVIRAMGFHDGIFHCELKNTSKGPRIIEINPRMGGGPVRALHQLAYGLDLAEETLYSALAIPNVPSVTKSPKRFVSCGEKFFQHSMVIPKEFCQVVEAMRLFPNVVEATTLVEVGEKITGIQDGFPTRTARFIVYGNSPSEVESYTRKLLDMCDIPQVIAAQNKNG